MIHLLKMLMSTHSSNIKRKLTIINNKNTLIAIFAKDAIFSFSNSTNILPTHKGSFPSLILGTIN